VSYHLNATGEHVKQLQRKLLNLRYPLPRHGADGHLGQETITALEHWWIDMDEEDAEDGIQESEIARVCADFLKVYDDVQSRDANKFPQLVPIHGDPANSRGIRRWSQINSIVLHQTACVLPTLASWRPVPIHIGIPRSSGNVGKIFQLHPLTTYLYHANSLNSQSIGIEIEGNFPGLVADKSTHWAKGGGPHVLGAEQIQAARQSIDWIMSEAATAGGKITYMLAHRQSSKSRRGDPGDVIWKEVGIWAMDTYKLSDGGGGFSVGDGYRLPDQWTGQARGVKY
jgi:hypothetical protein